MKKVISLFMMSLFVLLSVSTKCYAEESQYNFNEFTLEDYIVEFATMTDDELNEYIDYCATQNARAIGPVQSAWLAAAQIASNNGFPCAGELVRRSVLGQDYREESLLSHEGFFTSKIVNTKAYEAVHNNITSTSSLKPKYPVTFEKKDNSDLFYALHATTAYVTKFPNPTGNPAYDAYEINIYDIFDFDMQDYDSGFTSLINNWAYLCQNTNVLTPINVDIFFYD